MHQMPDLQNLQNCGDLTDGQIIEKSTFSFAKEPIATLQFTGPEGLTWENFERLCCRLMAKLFNLHGCRRYASGRNQEGIDICGYRSASPDSLIVIQCKRHVAFDLTKFKDAVREFKEGSFYGNVSEFIILAACELLPKTVEQEASKVREELAAKHCLFDIWNGEKISERLKDYPEIVEAFYRQEVVRALCQPWGLRQRVLELMLNSYRDQGSIPLSDKLVANEDQEAMARFLAEKTVLLHGDGLLFNHFFYTDAHITVESCLPTQMDYAGSCLITIKQANLSGGFFSLGHANIMRLFVQGTRTSIRKYRPFFLHELSDRGRVAVQLGAGGAYLHDLSFKSLCDGSDGLADAYISALNQLEAIWGARRFPFTHTGSVVVSLGHMYIWLWDAILRFAERHDVQAGTSDWHVFDAPSHQLKVYTLSQSKSLNRGYHARISAATKVSDVADQVRLFWHPPYVGHETIGERDFWTCEFTFNWLRDKLIPTVLQEIWSAERRRPWMSSRGRQRYEAEFRTWVQDWQIVDPRSPNLASYSAAQGMRGLWTVVSELQKKYSIYRHDFPVSGEIMAGICKMLSFLAARAEMNYWGYVSSKLQLKATNKQEIISEIESKGKLIASEEDATWMIDVAMRAAMELVNNGDIQLASDEVESCLEFLRPVIEIYELCDLIDRHTPRSE